MESTENTGTQPPPPPPPSPPSPPRPTTPLWEEAPAAREGDRLVLQVRRRMLWVGTAAIPLHNITWVDAFRIKPDRGAIFGRTLVWMAVASAVVAVGLSSAQGEALSSSRNTNLVALLVLIALVVATLRAVLASRDPVLAVAMAGGSTVIVTLPTVEELRQIAGQIVYAINHPDAEFTAIVNQFTSSNTNHFGPVVNMNGGSGNTGIKL
ncbi:DUF6232 family protein [Streptomyces sp. NPDC058157]|uniref:DUF6232 family protein n=1 Tax=Streptomyces sp. NPDC058157 TaxID=3346360 RepID=UPI0036EA8B51